MAEEEKVIRAFPVLGIQPAAMSMVTSTVLAPGSSLPGSPGTGASVHA